MLKVTQKNDSYIPIRSVYQGVLICFDYEPYYDVDAEGNQIATDIGTWTEAIISPKPSFNKIQNFILDTINKETDNRILSGFTWNGHKVWLSSENQFNYKAAYDLAIQSNGANLPTVFKFGPTNKPTYYKFESIEELQDFYTKAMTYINNQLAIGWAKKDAINWEDYKLK